MIHNRQEGCQHFTHDLSPKNDGHPNALFRNLLISIHQSPPHHVVEGHIRNLLHPKFHWEKFHHCPIEPCCCHNDWAFLFVKRIFFKHIKALELMRVGLVQSQAVFGTFKDFSLFNLIYVAPAWKVRNELTRIIISNSINLILLWGFWNYELKLSLRSNLSCYCETV